jgi:hypothetical protein
MAGVAVLSGHIASSYPVFFLEIPNDWFDRRRPARFPLDLIGDPNQLLVVNFA